MRNGRHNSGAIGRWWGRLLQSPLPEIGCEISQLGVSIARWSHRSSGFQSVSWRPLPAGSVEASPLRENVQQADAVRRAFADAIGSIGIFPGHGPSKRASDAVLVIPDQAARLFVLNFDTFPESTAEGLPLVRWRLKKSVPFEIDSAAISYFMQRSASELQVVAVATPQWIVRQYEALAEAFGLKPVMVTLSTLASLALANGDREPANSRNGILVAKCSPPWLTAAVLQGGMLRLFRTMQLSGASEQEISVPEALGAFYPSVAYFQDNFQGTVTHAYLCGFGHETAPIMESLERELNLMASPLVPSAAQVAAEPGQAERDFAALLGVVREQQQG